MRPYMDESTDTLPTGTVTFLFTDIEGSTTLVQHLDPSTYRAVLEEHNRLLRTVFQDHGGVERGTQGDSFLVIFRDAPSAVAAAVDAQRLLGTATWPGGIQIRVRMGLHTGAGVHGGDDYVGVDINRAARIASAAHGGQVLISDSTRALANRSLPGGVGLRDVGEYRLKGLEFAERIYQLTIDGLRSDFPPLNTVDIGSAHVPPRMTSFVGRRADLDALRGLLGANRLVTLVGPGGTGKTSLAIELAREVAADFSSGAWFVDLAPLSDPDLVGPTVARTLGLSERAEKSLVELLETYVEAREILLVLDNFEHLMPASVLVGDLLAKAPGLRVLVTSRRILNLYGEQQFLVPSLTIPGEATGADPETLAGYEAVMLFLQRARAAKPAFSITNDNALAVARICALLDGLPLAIELVASRIGLLEPGEILVRLERRVPVLTAGATNAPARQQTLKGAIDWSYDLLDPTERELLLRLAIFVGGCTLDAADIVCNAGGELGLDTFEGIASLVAQSLVRQQSDSGESRYIMLETIRAYALDRLGADGSFDEIGQRHVLYFRDLAELAEPHLLGSEANWLDRFEGEHDNVRGALGRALATRDGENGLRLAAALWRFWFQRGYLREGRSWLEAFLALDPGAVSSERAKAYIALGGLAYWLADFDTTEDAYHAARNLYSDMEDREGEAEAVYNLGFLPGLRDNPEEAMRQFEAGLALAREIENPHLVARNQLSLATATLAVGDPRGALLHSEEALRFFRSAGDRFHTAWALGLSGEAHTFLGDLQAGRKAYLEALRVVMEVKDLPLIAATLEEIGALESLAGNHDEAMHLMGAALALTEATGASLPRTALTRREVDQVARQAIGHQAVEEALAEGRRMTLEEAVAYAAHVLGD